ncbi:metallophosphoesterase [Adhaeretor mobilis]|nr:metallophosphoesterase [Adhaeretor mobilis]
MIKYTLSKNSSRLTLALLVSCSLSFSVTAFAQVERIWISHQSNNPDKTVINWQTTQAGPSVVNYGLSLKYGETAEDSEATTLHQVEIDTPARDVVYYFQVVTGEQQSTEQSFKAYPTKELRVALTGNWQTRPDLQALLDDDPHLVIGLGDYVWDTYGPCGKKKVCFKPFEGLIDSYPKLFRTTPFLAVMGNHDRQWLPRPTAHGDPAPEPVYDIAAQSITHFLAQPDEEWKWSFEVPEFHLRLVAIDNAHVTDNGTNLQACHDVDAESEQFLWYKNLVETTDTSETSLITLYNSSNTVVANPDGVFKHWKPFLRKNTAILTGYGLYAERAEMQGLPWYNSSLVKGRPQDMYFDKNQAFGAGVSSYVLMKFNNDTHQLVIELKNVEDGSVLDTKTLAIP